MTKSKSAAMPFYNNPWTNGRRKLKTKIYVLDKQILLILLQLRRKWHNLRFKCCNALFLWPYRVVIQVWICNKIWSHKMFHISSVIFLVVLSMKKRFQSCLIVNLKQLEVEVKKSIKNLQKCFFICLHLRVQIMSEFYA